MAARRDPLRTTAVLIPALVALALVPLLLRQTYRTVITSTQGRAQPTVPPATQLPATPASLLVLDDAQGRPVTAALLAPRPTAPGGLLLVLPLGTQTVGATGQSERLDATYATSGLDGFARGVEGLFGITIAAAAELGPTDAGVALAPLTPITVAFTDPVRSLAVDGSTAVVVPAGSAALGGPEAAAVLGARADESELVRLDRVQAVWQALLATRQGQTVELPAPTAAPSTTAPAATTTVAVDGATTTVAAAAAPTSTTTPAAAFAGADTVVAALGAIATGPNQVRVLTEQVVADTVGTADERFVADPATMRLLVAEVLPGAVSPANGNLRLRVLNPSGDESVAYQAVAKLTFVSANVIVVDNTAGPVPETSALTYADDARAAEMSGLVPVIGSLSIATTDERIDGVDATVTLGLDFVTAARRAAAASPTTTAAAVPATAIDTTASTIADITTTTKKTS